MSDSATSPVAASTATSADRIVLSRGAHTERLVAALTHMRETLHTPEEDFTRALAQAGADKAATGAREGTIRTAAGAQESRASSENPAQPDPLRAARLDFVAHSLLRDHVSPARALEPNASDPGAASSSRVEPAAAVPDVADPDEMADLRTRLDADSSAPPATPDIKALARSQDNFVPPEVLEAMRTRHLSLGARLGAHADPGGWPRADTADGGEDE